MSIPTIGIGLCIPLTSYSPKWVLRALCECTSFPTILPMLNFINLASTNPVGKKMESHIYFLSSSEGEHYIWTHLPPYIPRLHLLPRLSLIYFASVVAAAKGPHTYV